MKAAGSIASTKAPIRRGVEKSGPAIGKSSKLSHMPVNAVLRISASPANPAPL